VSQQKQRISFQEIDTDNLILRRFKEHDFALFRSLEEDPAVIEHLRDGHPQSLDETGKALRKILLDYQNYQLSLLAVHLKSSGEFMGRAGLIPWVIDGELVWELGCTLFPQFWSKGYAQELGEHFKLIAFAQLGVRYLYGFIRPSNERSIKAAERLGMEYWKDSTIENKICRVYRIQLDH
jgi:RimJ/RimL family protein N-acetyltransferase